MDPNLITIIMPLSWAAAVSPTALSVFLIMMSMTDNPKLSGFSFYLGAIFVLLLTVLIGFLMGNALQNTGHADPVTIASIDIFLGAILVLLGIRSAFSKGHKRNSSLFEYLKIDKKASNFTKFRRYFTVGLLTFLINFSTAIFVLAAGRQIGIANVGLWADIGAVAVLTIITLIVVEVPLFFFLVFPKTAERVTQPMNQWLSNHTNLVMAAFLLFIGGLIIYNGLSRMGVS
jgi:threonine/homoserine/homoserine lactone efflux protein